jgi:hypothetical protein
MLHTNNIAKQLSTEIHRKLNSHAIQQCVVAEISGRSREVNALHTVTDKFPYGIMCKSTGAHQIEYLAL